MSDRYRTPQHRPEAARRQDAVAKALGRSGRVLFVGSEAAGSGEEWPDADVELRSEDELENVPEKPFDAALWVPSHPALDALPEGDLPERFRDLLEDRGRLLVEVPSERRLPAEEALSEAGFLIRRAVRLLDEELLDAETDGDADADRRRLVVARRDPYRIRPCEEPDEEEILRLFVPLFHVARTAEHWRWKYLENPWGRRWISLAVSPDGELAAHYAGYPVPFVRHPPGAERDRMLGVQIGDTMTAPGRRRVGLGDANLLGRAIRHHIARFSRGRAAFYYGFNTGNIRKYNLRFIQVRWGGTVGYWRRSVEHSAEPPVATSLLGGAVRIGASGPGGDLERALDGRFGREADVFFDRVSPHYGLLVRRDARWLRWRYAHCPDDPPFVLLAVRRFGRFGALVGWGVFRRHVAEGGRSELRWVDALFDPRHAHRAADLLRAALRDPALRGPSFRDSTLKQEEARDVQEVTAWFSPRPAWWLDRLDALGFERRPEPDDLGLIYRPFERPDADEFIHELYYTWSDSDLA